jgi:hypothetical protein
LFERKKSLEWELYWKWYNLQCFHARYLAILFPHQPLSPFSSTILLITIWTVSGGLASPTLLFSTTKNYGSEKVYVLLVSWVYNMNFRGNLSSSACILIWPDGPASISLMDHMYQLVFFLMTYLLPLLGLSITYTYLGRVLWRMQWQRKSQMVDDRRTLRVKKEMQKVKMAGEKHL